MANARQLFERGLMEAKLKLKGIAKGKDTRIIPQDLSNSLPPLTPKQLYQQQGDQNLTDPGGVIRVPLNRTGPALGPGKREFDYIDPIALPVKKKRTILQS